MIYYFIIDNGLKTKDTDLQLTDELLFVFKQTSLNQSIPMLRSNHLQPGINLNPISFPSADLTLKVLNYNPIYIELYIFIHVTNKE